MRRRSVPLLLALALNSGCATFHLRGGGAGEVEALPEEFLLRIPDGGALRLRGSADGPLGGIGPSLEFDAWLSEEGLRADLRYEEEGRRRHEVLLWTAESVLLFDRDRGGLTELGHGATLPAWGTEFSLQALHWLCLGRWPADRPLPVFRRAGRDWEASEGPLSLQGRAVDRSPWLARTGLRWEDEGQTRGLSAELEAQQVFAEGRIPRRVRLDGDPLELEIRLTLNAQLIEKKGDRVMDPLSDP